MAYWHKKKQNQKPSQNFPNSTKKAQNPRKNNNNNNPKNNKNPQTQANSQKTKQYKLLESITHWKKPLQFLEGFS